MFLFMEIRVKFCVLNICKVWHYSLIHRNRCLLKEHSGEKKRSQRNVAATDSGMRNRLTGEVLSLLRILETLVFWSWDKSDPHPIRTVSVSAPMDRWAGKGWVLLPSQSNSVKENTMISWAKTSSVPYRAGL